MVDRVWIEPNVFRISKTGQPVLSAVDSQLLFNGSYAGTAKFIRAQVSGSRGGNGATSNTIFYGKTFSVKPMVFVYEVNTAAGTDGGSYPGQGFQAKGLSDSETPCNFFSFSFTRFTVDVQLDRVNFSTASASSPFTYTIHAAILDYRFGM